MIIFTYSVMIASTLMSFSVDAASKLSDEKLQQVANNYNRALPAVVAPNLKQEKITVSNGVLTYAYTHTTKNASQLAAMNLQVTQLPYIFPKICNNSATGRLLREGVTFKLLC